MSHFQISVVHRSPGKMILSIQLCLVLIVAWVNNVACASVSKVYVRNQEPVEYYQYGSQAAIAYSNPQYAQLTSAPVGSVVPSYDYVSPCIPPSCLYPSQTIASVAAPSANIMSYQAPIASLPIVTASNRQDPGYEYSYIVYNQETGDKKSHSELSDGSVVRGQYSFLQPDGFNVIVKNYFPNAEEKSNVEAPPCPEAKNETPQKEPEVETDNANEEKHALSSEGPSHESIVQAEEKHEGSHSHTPEHPKEHEFNPAVETKEEHDKHSVPESHEEHKVESHENPIVVYHSEVSQTPSSEDNILVSYSDIIKCITAALNRAQTGFSQPDTALRYIVLNKPC